MYEFIMAKPRNLGWGSVSLLLGLVFLSSCSQTSDENIVHAGMGPVSEQCQEWECALMASPPGAPPPAAARVVCQDPEGYILSFFFDEDGSIVNANALSQGVVKLDRHGCARGEVVPHDMDLDACLVEFFHNGICPERAGEE